MKKMKKKKISQKKFKKNKFLPDDISFMSPKETFKRTYVVIEFSLIIAGIIVMGDYIFGSIIKFIF